MGIKMREVTPEVYLVSRPEMDMDKFIDYLRNIDARDWVAKLENEEIQGDTQDLVETAGRICYRSWEPGLNPNITKVRTDQGRYLENILISGHGSVLEHADFTFILHNVSRVFTHELVRHRAGCSISQESMRYVRLDEIPFWFPDWAHEDDEVMVRSRHVLDVLERHQKWMAEHFHLDDEGTPFQEKKHKTSFMRRFAPEGVATDIMWTANLRTLRHVIELRTSDGAEEEIKLLFGMVIKIMKSEAPALFTDFTLTDEGAWVPAYRKV
jgi:thymidylate synthase (FAD)